MTFEADLNLAGISSVSADAASRASLLADIDRVTIDDLERAASIISRHHMNLTTFTGIT